MKDLSAYYEIARLITAELSETITPEEKERLNVWLAEDERHYMRYCRIRERLKRGEGENVFRNPERVREDMEKLKRNCPEINGVSFCPEIIFGGMALLRFLRSGSL